MSDYAVVKHGGKQYRVSPGDELLVERTEADLAKGDNLLFEQVMMVSQGENVRVGTPLLEGALVKAQVLAAVRGDKVIVFKKKRRKGYRRSQGHRQDYYRVRVEAIGLQSERPRLPGAAARNQGWRRPARDRGHHPGAPARHSLQAGHQREAGR